jgi:hypothetical protein
VNAALTQLESRLDRGEVDSPECAARMLRDASYKLGHLESRGEPGWKTLDENARDDAVRLLRKVEKAVAPERRAQ